MVRMGHASPQAALRYQHATRDRDAAIAQALSSLVEQARTPASSTARGPQRARGRGRQRQPQVPARKQAGTQAKGAGQGQLFDLDGPATQARRKPR
jgi:hypothetical protein